MDDINENHMMKLIQCNGLKYKNPLSMMRIFKINSENDVSQVYD